MSVRSSVVWLHVLVCVGLACMITSQSLADDASAKPAPQLSCKASTFEFGAKDNSETVSHTFLIANTGTAPLVISKIQPACGCTVAKLTKDHIEPGAQAFIAAELSLKGQKGKIEKAITIHSDDPDQPEFRVWLKGEATAAITLAPESVHFRSVTTRSDAERTVDLLIDEKAAFNILSVGSKNPHIQVKQETVNGGMYYQFHIKLVPPLTKGVLRDSITIQTDSQRYPQLTVPVTADVVGEVAVTPERVVLPATSEQALVRYILMSPGSVDSFKIESVEVPKDSGIQAEVTPLGKSGYRVRLSGIHPDAKLNGQLITIATDVPTMAHIELPIEVSAK